MRFAVDAHAIGRNLTGNEIYVRSLLRGFAETDRNSEFLAYISATGAERWVPERFGIRRVSANPYSRPCPCAPMGSPAWFATTGRI